MNVECWNYIRAPCDALKNRVVARISTFPQIVIHKNLLFPLYHWPLEVYLVKAIVHTCFASNFRNFRSCCIVKLILVSDGRFNATSFTLLVEHIQRSNEFNFPHPKEYGVI